MVARPSIVAVLVGALASMGASFRTPNFVVDAPNAQVAQQVGQYAEHYRKEKALQWLGQEMPQWRQPCPLKVTITMNGSGGATSFAFDQGQILGMEMHIEGAYDRLLASVLPHEVTHTVFAHYFRCPVPRWADEGGSVLSEDDQERNHHDQLVRQILNSPGRAIPLRRLFQMKQYPPDVMVLYAEGFSVSNYLVNKSNRSVFLAFVHQGMRGDWDAAVRAYYHLNSVEELERAWMQDLRDNRQLQQPGLLASRNPDDGSGAQRVVVRQTVPPAQPFLDSTRPTVRGQSSEGDEAPNPYPAPSGAARQASQASQQPNPYYNSSPFPAAPQRDWQMHSQQPVLLPPPPPVLLTSPQVDNPPPVELGSPVGGQ
jgi:hypothetical protein